MVDNVEICLLIGDLTYLERRMTTVVHGMIQLHNNEMWMEGVHEWKSYGFQSEKAFEGVVHRTDLVIVNATAMNDPGSCGWLSNLLESVGAMGVIIGLVYCASKTFEAVCQESAILWLEGHVIVLTCMPGGVAVSYRLGRGGAGAGRRVAEVLSAAGVGEVAVGVGLYGGPGRVVRPSDPAAFVLLAEPGIVLDYSAFSGAYCLVGASLARSGLERIPRECVYVCIGLTLVSLPSELRTISALSFLGAWDWYWWKFLA
jgi:hypothetical protein